MMIFMRRLLTGWLLPLNYQLMQLVKKIFAPKEVKVILIIMVMMMKEMIMMIMPMLTHRWTIGL